MKNKVLIWDIETSPITFEGWSLWQFPSRIIEDWRIICVAYKWLDEDKVHFVANWQFGNPKNDKRTAQHIRDLLDEADIIIAHNGDKFDQKKAKARFLYHGIEPPSPYRTIDTLKVAKREFALTSNRLDDIAKFFKIQGKLQHESFFEMWDKIKANDKRTQNLMRKYNIQDVKLLQDIYYKMRPYITNHPNLSVVEQSDACPKCSSLNIQSRGLSANNTGTFQRLFCKDCRSWFQHRQMEKGFRPKYIV